MPAPPGSREAAFQNTKKETAHDPQGEQFVAVLVAQAEI